MTMNGITIPFPSEFATPPASSSQTGRGSCGFRLCRYAVAAFSAAQDYFGIRWLPSGLLIDSSIKEETRRKCKRMFSLVEFAVQHRLRKCKSMRSDLTVDPRDGCTFWYTQEYLGQDLLLIGTWRPRIVSFRFPGCR
jgi:hypothetical protein